MNLAKPGCHPRKAGELEGLRYEATGYDGIGAISPTPVSPTYYRSVPFHLLMHNVKKSVLLGKQYSSSLCASQIYG